MERILSTALESYVQNTLITSLKEYFSYIPEYSYDVDPAKTSISIVGEGAKVSVLYPAVVVSGISGDLLKRCIGDEVNQVFYGDRLVNGMWIPHCVCGYRTGGAQVLDITVHVIGRTSAMVRAVRDYVAMFFRVVYYNNLKQRNITLQGLQAMSPSTRTVGNDLFFIEPIQIRVFTEWKEIIYDVPLITGVNFTGLSITV